MNIFVSIVDAKGKKQTFPLREKPIIIGRSSKSHIVISDEVASSQHLMIFLEGNCVYIEDLKSKNGILLNGIRVYKQRIYIDDKVKFGDTVLYFETKKMDEAALNLLKSNSNSRLDGSLTLELETHKEKTKRIKHGSSIKKGSKDNKDFVKNSKLYAGVSDNKDSLEGKSFNKHELIIREYLATFIDSALGIFFFAIPFIILKFFFPEKYSIMIKPDLGIKTLTEGDTLYLSIGAFILSIIFFKWNRRRKNGSIAEKLLGLD